jgi:Fe-S oxidoreductase
MASFKAEFQYQYFKDKGMPLRHRLFAENASLNSLGAKVSGLTNFVFSNSLTSSVLKKIMGVHPQRDIPTLAKQTLRSWYKKQYPKLKPPAQNRGKVWFFFDEYTNLLDAQIGVKAIELLHHLGYEVMACDHAESGRSHFSKGLLDRAKKFAEKNVRIFSDKVTEEIPLVGVEPSSILGFRDEYPRLVDKSLQAKAKNLGKQALMIEEFLKREIDAGRITAEDFQHQPKHILLHGHCHQKSLASVQDAAFLLGLPAGYTVEVIPSGCCGMAGSFGYEKEHYEVSMKVGELVLFPRIRKASADTVIAAAGTSCRHQIKDGTQRAALHPVELLWEVMAP